MRLISWNVNGRMASVADQVAALGTRDPDVVALVEVRLAAFQLFRRELAAQGLGHMLGSFRRAQAPTGPRLYGVILASRWPLTGCVRPRAKWPERCLPVIVSTPTGPVEVHAVYVPPGSSNGWAKIETLEAVFRHLARPATIPRVLCGDFNTPQEQTEDGRVLTWAQRRGSNGEVSLKRSRGER
jgi:exonuclease III